MITIKIAGHDFTAEIQIGISINRPLDAEMARQGVTLGGLLDALRPGQSVVFTDTTNDTLAIVVQANRSGTWDVFASIAALDALNLPGEGVVSTHATAADAYHAALALGAA